MSHHRMAQSGCGNCKVYVKAAKCPSNDSDYDTYVHKDDLPSSKSWFEFASENIEESEKRNCWSIDPNDPLVCLPKDVLVATGPFEQPDCTTCKEDEGDNGSAGGDGAGSGNRGGWLPPPPPLNPPRGYPV